MGSIILVVGTFLAVVAALLSRILFVAVVAGALALPFWIFWSADRGAGFLSRQLRTWHGRAAR
jgi:hypothetical protein